MDLFCSYAKHMGVYVWSSAGQDRNQASGQRGTLDLYVSGIDEEISMCSPVPCSSCGKTTWSGCGDHVDEVMANVPLEKRCLCQ